MSLGGGALGVLGAGGSGGAPSVLGWTQEIDIESAYSLAPWNIGPGAWSADASGIHQTSTSAGASRIQYARPLPGVLSAAEATIEFATGQGGDLMGGLELYCRGPNDTGGLCVRLQRESGVGAIECEEESVSSYGSLSYPVNEGTPYTILVVSDFTGTDIFINGTYEGTLQKSSAILLSGTWAPALYANDTVVTYTDIRYWRSASPAGS